MNFFKKHRKGIIAIVIIAAIIVGGYFGLKNLGKRTIEEFTKASVETATIEKRDLVSVVSATGKVTSLESKSLSSIATGSKVLSVDVKVGDEVKAGDVLFTLDAADYEKTLENLNDTLEITKKSNNLQVNAAQRSYNEALTNSQLTDERYAEQISDSEKNLEDSKQLRDQAETLYKNAISTRELAEFNYNGAVADLSTIKETMKKTDPTDSKALSKLSKQLEKTEGLIKTYKGSLDAAKQAESAQLANYQSYKTTVESLEKSLESVNQNVSDAKRQSELSIASTKDSLTSAKLSTSNNTFSIETQIDSVTKQIDDCVVYAPFTGVVTSVNVSEGETYTGMGGVTVEDISSFEISTEIDEYDIGKIKVGQRVVIRTNGTGDKEMEGVVKSIAPRATVSMGTSSSVTYTVVVSLKEMDESIRLDMTAKLSIVLSAASQTLTVPYDAVNTDDDGNTFIKVIDSKNEDGTYNTHDVYITTGIETDYYTEIVSGDVHDQDEILVERTKSNVFNLNEMFGGNAMGGM